MSKIRVAIALAAVSVIAACAPTAKLKMPGIPDIDILKSAENVRVYQADYETVFRASLSALRRIDDTSAKLVKHSEGVIVFKKPKDTGTITVIVKRVDEKNTRVEISAKNRRKYWLDGGDGDTRDAFFEGLDKLLGIAEAEASERAGESAAETSPDKTPVLSRLRKQLQLDEGESFLDELSYGDLVLLDRRFESLSSISSENKKLPERCAACYIDLARLYHDDGRYKRSAEALRIAVSIDPINAVARCNLGEIYKHLGLYEKAIQELDEAARLDPDFADTFINLGIIHDDYLSDDAKALKNYRRYLELGGADEQVLGWISEIEAGS